MCIRDRLRDAQRLVGRPDVWTVSVGTAESAQAQIAAGNPVWGVRQSHLDGRMVSILTEMTTNNAMLNKSLHYRSYGNVFGNLCGAIFGGHAGGTEGTLVLQTAYNIEGACLYGSCWALNFPFHLKWQSTTTRELLWLQSVLSQAMSRNSNLIFLNNLFANAGPGTEPVSYTHLDVYKRQSMPIAMRMRRAPIDEDMALQMEISISSQVTPTINLPTRAATAAATAIGTWASRPRPSNPKLMIPAIQMKVPRATGKDGLFVLLSIFLIPPLLFLVFGSGAFTAIY